MKGLAFILLIAAVGIGIWGNAQSNAKTKAIKETVELKKEVSEVKSENKKLNSTVDKQKQKIIELENTEKLLNAKTTLHQKNVEALEVKVSSLTKENIVLKQHKADNAVQERRVVNARKTRRKVPVEIRRSQDLTLKITKLKHKVALLDNQIDNYQSRARNARYAIVKMTKDDAKGWYYRKGGDKYHLKSMSELPRHWHRGDIRIIYISKAEKQEKLKQQYLLKVSELQKEKSALASQLSALQK